MTPEQTANVKAIAEALGLILALAAAVLALWSASKKYPDIMQTRLSGEGSLTDLMNKQGKWTFIAGVLALFSVIVQVIPVMLR